jgi:hypothetical protein
MTSDALAPAPSTALTVIDRGTSGMLSIRELQDRRLAILDVMANVLENGKDYGRIPGTDKPTLFKPGGEQLMLTFSLAATDPTIEDLATDDQIRYRLRVPIENAVGRVLAVGVGEASTNEEKYRWRKAVCDEEWEETPESLRREKWFKGRNEKPWKGKQIRTSPADLANTALKMAHKRAFIHGVLLATGASSVFNQDLEDFNKELQESVIEGDVVARSAPASKPAVDPPAAAEPSAPPAAKVAAPRAPTLGPLVTEPRRVKEVKENKGQYWITLHGEPKDGQYERSYSTRDVKKADEIRRFVGTDHLVRLGYEENDWQGRTYRNVKGFAVDDAAPTMFSTGK